MFHMSCLAAWPLELVSEYKVVSQQIYFPDWGIVAFAIVLHLMYVRKKSILEDSSFFPIMDTKTENKGEERRRWRFSTLLQEFIQVANFQRG